MVDAIVSTEAATNAARRVTLEGRMGDPRASLAGPMARFSLRLRESAIEQAGAALGLDLALPICRGARANGRTALRLGPDEWLVFTTEDDAESLAGSLRPTASGREGALVDISHRQIGIVLDGAHITEMLNGFSPLDLDLSSFPVGMATRTVFAKAEIVLWRQAETRFHLEAWRSFAPYVWGLLTEIGREYPV